MNKWSSSQSEELMKERKDTGCLDWYRNVNQDKRLVWEYSQKPKKDINKNYAEFWPIKKIWYLKKIRSEYGSGTGPVGRQHFFSMP